MRYTLLAGLAAMAVAVPMEKRSKIDDAKILNYALALEYLEDAFYKEGVKKFSAEDFKKANAVDGFYEELQEIAKDESTHVTFLKGALGHGAVEPCEYDFGVKTASDFLGLAQVLEGVGVSAYLGAARYIVNKDYLTAAGSILTVEARHSAYLRENATPPKAPAPSPFDIPLDFDEVYSLAAQFIKSCPKANTAKWPPLKAFAALTVYEPTRCVKPGEKIKVKVAKSISANSAWFITTTGPVRAKLSGSGDDYAVIIPEGLQQGQAYLVFTYEEEKPTDDNILAGPAIVSIADVIFGKPIGGYWAKDGYHRNGN